MVVMEAWERLPLSEKIERLSRMSEPQLRRFIAIRFRKLQREYPIMEAWARATYGLFHHEELTEEQRLKLEKLRELVKKINLEYHQKLEKRARWLR